MLKEFIAEYQREWNRLHSESPSERTSLDREPKQLGVQIDKIVRQAKPRQQTYFVVWSQKFGCILMRKLGMAKDPPFYGWGVGLFGFARVGLDTVFGHYTKHAFIDKGGSTSLSC
jgi:hypothetical protein